MYFLLLLYVFLWLCVYSQCYVNVFYCFIQVFSLLCLCILPVTYIPFCVFCFIVLFCVLFVCKCVLYCCHRVSTKLQLKNISYHIIYIISYQNKRQVTENVELLKQDLLWVLPDKNCHCLVRYEKTKEEEEGCRFVRNVGNQ